MKMCSRCKNYRGNDIVVNGLGVCVKTLLVVDKYYKRKYRCRFYKKIRKR